MARTSAGKRPVNIAVQLPFSTSPADRPTKQVLSRRRCGEQSQHPVTPVLHPPTVGGCQWGASSWPLLGEVRLDTWVPSACITYRLGAPARLLPNAILVPSGE